MAAINIPTKNYESTQNTDIRNNWSEEEILAIYHLPFADLLYNSASLHRKYFDPNKIQASALLSIKTGSCPEDCKYCPQSAHYNTELKKEPLISLEEVKTKAIKAKNSGASRFCMGAAWRKISDKDLPQLTAMIKTVKEQGLETCMTLGMASLKQLNTLKSAGLDYYNHNIDTSEEYYDNIITTRKFSDRLETLNNVAKAELKTCCGGIIGMGETVSDRIKMLQTLANLDNHPQSVPINMLVKIKGTPLANEEPLDNFAFIRTIATARIVMPKSYVRLSAGRQQMSEEMQALCFFAGANSIFYGEKLLTTKNPDTVNDDVLFAKLGLKKS